MQRIGIRMSDKLSEKTARIGAGAMETKALGLGCWSFGGSGWGGQDDDKSREAMAAALQADIGHFDTASGYGRGHSEDVIGEYLSRRKAKVFLASKTPAGQLDAQGMLERVEQSLRRLRRKTIDLYYIHWPRRGEGVDMRPAMEGLELARQQKKIRAVGVSNFSIAEMEHVSEAGSIDAHQLCYNLLWRKGERELIPWLREHGCAVVAYGALGMGILSGKFPRHPEFAPGDTRSKVIYFRPDVWPRIYEAVREMLLVAEAANQPLAHLAIQWILRQPGVDLALVGAREGWQMEQNAQALEQDIDEAALDRLTQISDQLAPSIPSEDNIFGMFS